VSQSQSGGFVCLRVSIKVGCVSESVWRLGVSLSQSGGFVCLRVSLEASCISESV